MSNRNSQALGLNHNTPTNSLLSGKSVLICDDSAIQRRKLRELFHSLDLQCVAECGNGLECLNIAETLKPDLVSLDVLMPVMHGLETVKYLRENEFRGFVIFVSALGAEDALNDYPFGSFAPDAIFSKRDTRDSFRNILEQMFESQVLNESFQKQKMPLRKQAS